MSCCAPKKEEPPKAELTPAKTSCCGPPKAEPVPAKTSCCGPPKTEPVPAKTSCCGPPKEDPAPAKTSCCGPPKVEPSAAELRASVAQFYGKIGSSDSSCCLNPGEALGSVMADPHATAKRLGYQDADLQTLPGGANLGLSCGNPQAIASLKEGSVVLDLGSGAGFDAFLAARKVGASGKVIGVDMAPEMLARARDNALKGGRSNVEFRLGEIEHLPVADSSVDVIISNCVINLSPEKLQVFKEAFRVLKPGGRIALSDPVVCTRDDSEVPAQRPTDMDSYCSCISGAITPAQYEVLLAEAGFTDITITVVEDSREVIAEWVPGAGVESWLVSGKITAYKK